jgi:CRISPR-associated protein (TIGR03986 family)
MSKTRPASTVLPYHFVPVKAGPREDDVDVGSFRLARPDRLGHHRFVAGCRSGRVLCRLTTESPAFVGAERQPAAGEDPAVVEPFELDGRPAIPASTLRGVISSIAEAAAGSALRVLDNRAYSYRAAMGGSLSAIGEVIVEGRGEERRWSLRPIALPTLQCNRSGDAALPREFEGWFNEPRLKVYVEDKDSLRAPLETYRADSPQFYGMELYRGRKWDSGNRLAFDHGQRSKQTKRGSYLVAQWDRNSSTRPVPWDKIAESERQKYTKGIVRVMQDADSSRDLPNTRHHELFLPYDPKEAESWPRFPILPEAVERFHQLADERTDAHRPGTGPLLPYEPVGTERNPEPKDDEDRSFRLKTGDLVYFRPTRDGKAVAEIALSAIWRRRVEDRATSRGHGAWSFFEAVDPELVPFHEGRTRVTAAEQLFGFVSEGDPTEAVERLPALKSRVRFASARLDESVTDPYLDACTLKILDSPKPPSPTLYFIDVEGRPIEKGDLDPKVHRPQGRKHYVHQKWRAGTPEQEGPWRTADERERRKMKTRVRPLRDGLTFTFHVDFDNLTDRELGLLLYALRPTAAFRHQVGMGKPIGLGTVRIDVHGCFEVDRQERYTTAGLFAPRYRRAWAPLDCEPAKWPAAYETERTTIEDLRATGSWVDDLRRSYRDTIDGEIRNALERLGEESFEPAEVSWPLAGDGDGETKSFEWFVSNAQLAESDRKTLRPIRQRGWPRLPRLPRRENR